MGNGNRVSTLYSFTTYAPNRSSPFALKLGGRRGNLWIENVGGLVDDLAKPSDT